MLRAERGGGLQTGSDVLLVSAALFVVSLDCDISWLSVYGSMLVAAYGATIAASVISYGLWLSGRGNRFKLACYILCAISIAFFVASVLLCVMSGTASFLGQENYILDVATFFVMFIIVFFVASLYFYTKNRKARVVIVAAVIAAAWVLLYFYLIYYVPNDETLISYYAIKSALAGMNPYSQNVAVQLYNYYKSMNYPMGLTLTASNGIVSSMDYPALFLLVQVPFYLATNVSISNITEGFMHSESFSFFLVFLLSYFMVAGKKGRKGPDLVAYMLFGFSLVFMVSLATYLMMALIMLMYSDYSEKYSWAFLGLAASMQQQLWVIVLLFIAYSFNRYGAKRGLRDLAGSAAIFLVINCYFIAASPATYVNAITSTESALLPDNSAPIGYLLSSYYQMPLQSFAYLFVCVTAIVLVASMYINDKRIIPIISMIPFMFLNHAQFMYYLLPMTIFAFIADVKAKRDGGNMIADLARKAGGISLMLPAAIILAAVAIVYWSHAAYLSRFGLSASNQFAVLDGNGNITYMATLRYVPQNDVPMYLAFYVYNRSVLYGPYVRSMINASSNCTFPCSVNDNVIRLTGSGTYRLTAEIPANVYSPGAVFALLYNGNYTYISPPVATERMPVSYLYQEKPNAPYGG